MSTITSISAKGGGDFLRLRFWGTVLLMLGALLALGAGSAHAAPLAGTSIGNQASASYTDANSVSRITVSNSVSTVVQQVFAAVLTQTQTKTVAPGQTVAFPHTIVNNGNGADTFTITAGNVVNAPAFQNSVAPTTITLFYNDANCDGVADNNTVLTGTPSIGPVAPGAQACFVAQVTAALTGTGSFDVGFASSTTGATLTNPQVTDTLVITPNAAINVSKSIDVSNGPSGQTVTYTLTYRNTGTVSAGNVVLADSLPVNAAYVANSARWSVTGVTVLTDGTADVPQGVAPYRVQYGNSGQRIAAVLERVDPGVQGTLTFQAVLTGTAGAIVTNQAQWCYKDIGINGTTIPTSPAAVQTACNAIIAGAGNFSAAYVPGTVFNPGGEIATVTGSTNTSTSTNIVPYLIVSNLTGSLVFNNGAGAGNDTGEASLNTVAAAAALGDPTPTLATSPNVAAATAGQGTTATWDVTVYNTAVGGADTFNITAASGGATTNNFPAGTTFLLFRSDGFTPLTDSNGDGVLDTGPVNGGSSYTVRITAILPPTGATGTYNGIFQAQSTNTLTATNRVDVRLRITASTVDLRNRNAVATGAGTGGVDGFGEVAPVNTYTANPSTVVTIGLTVANTSNVADSFDLSYTVAATGSYSLTAPYAFTSNAQFGGVATPGFALAFYRDASGAGNCANLGPQVSNTGVIGPNTSATAANFYCAVITVPAGATPGNFEIFFRALSPTTFTGTAVGGSADVKHDRLTINTVRAVSITPNNSGQIFPGGSIQYCHTVRNSGNQAETLTLTQSNQSLFGSGWGQYATVYIDTNKNCVLDGTESALPLTQTIFTAQAFGVGAVASATVNLIVVVQAPGSAIAGQTNQDTFTITAAVPFAAADTVTLVATDVTTVVVGQVQLVKDQVLDTTGTACSTPFNAGTLDAPAFAATFTQTQITTGAVPGSCIIYRVRATNVGTQQITAVTITDVSPPNTTLQVAAVAGTLGVTACVPASGSLGVANTSVSCTAATLGAGATTTMYFRVKINP